MSLFRQRLRPPSADAEEAVARRVAAIRAELEPDPLFRRRLRGVVLNQYVAGREARAPAGTPRAMGRLGRAVLYASVVLATSVGGVMAASQEALPGDALYPLKRHIEHLRHDVLPAHLADDLLALELTERVEELERLTERGRTGAVAGLVDEIRADYAALVPLGTGGSMLGARLAVLEALVDRLPEPARAAVEAVIAAAERPRGNDGNAGGSTGAGERAPGSTNGGGANAGRGSGSVPSQAAGGPDRTPPSATPVPASASERPERSPRAWGTGNRPSPTPSSSPDS
jgi:hypothetical protein